MNPTSPKRLKEKTLLEASLRTPRLSDSQFRILQMVDKRLDKQSLDIKEQIRELLQESEKRLLHQLENKLCEKLNEMRLYIDDVRERVDKLEREVEKNKTEIETNIIDLKKDIAVVMEKQLNTNTVSGETVELKSEVIYLRNKILQQENFAVACDLRIDGVPYVNNEDLYAIFNIMCTNLNIVTPAARPIYRIKTKNSSSAPTIIIKLMTPFDKKFILKTVSAYRRKNKDLLRIYLLNFDANNPFYINESLSQSNYRIFNKAWKRKRDKIFSNVYTVSGIVHVIKNETDQPIRILCEDELNQFFRRDGDEDDMEQ